MEFSAQILTHLKIALLSVADSLNAVSAVVKSPLQKLMLVMFGGGLGAASRYSVGLLAAKLWGTAFPWGTLLVNLAGCFFIGMLFALADRARVLTPEARLFLITGYLGALTTFSAFALETVSAGRDGLLLQPLLNILANNVGGLSFTVLGFWVGGR